MKKTKRFKFLRTGLKSHFGGFKWKIGQWYKWDGKLKMCKTGFHCSREPYDAFSYVQGEILAEVEVRGKSEKQEDKETWSEMRILRAWKWGKKDSVRLAIYCTELVLPNFEKEFPKDKRPRKAILAAKRWLWGRGDASAAESAAESAAWSVARSAARSAESAELAAAESAAWSAESAARSAESAAESAAWSAESAAESAAWSAESAAESAIKEIQQKFLKMVKGLEPYHKNKWVK